MKNTTILLLALMGIASDAGAMESKAECKGDRVAVALAAEIECDRVRWERRVLPLTHGVWLMDGCTLLAKEERFNGGDVRTFYLDEVQKLQPYFSADLYAEKMADMYSLQQGGSWKGQSKWPTFRVPFSPHVVNCFCNIVKARFPWSYKQNEEEYVSKASKFAERLDASVVEDVYKLAQLLRITKLDFLKTIIEQNNVAVQEVAKNKAERIAALQAEKGLVLVEGAFKLYPDDLMEGIPFSAREIGLLKKMYVPLLRNDDRDRRIAVAAPREAVKLLQSLLHSTEKWTADREKEIIANCLNSNHPLHGQRQHFKALLALTRLLQIDEFEFLVDVIVKLVLRKAEELEKKPAVAAALVALGGSSFA